MHRIAARALAIVVAIAAACSSGGGGSGDPSGPSLSVSPSEWTVEAGGAPKQFTATLTGSGDPVAWSIDTPGDAAHVGTIDAAGLYGPPAAIAVARDVVVKAVAAGLEARATVHVTALAGPFTISGRVVDDVGKPYSGARVLVQGRSALSAADGSFSIPSITAPYDATIVVESNTKVAVFRGVSDLAPVLWIWRGFANYRSATVTGTVTLAGTPTFAEVYGPWASAYAFGGSYSLSDFWFGDASVTLTHRATVVGYDPATGMPAAYSHGSRDVALTDGATVGAQDIAMAPLAAGGVAGTVLWHEGYDVGTIRFTGTPHFDDGTARTLWAYDVTTAPAGPFALAVPALPDGTFRIGYGADGPAGSGGSHASGGATAPAVPGRTGITLALPALPVAVSPADGAASAGGGAFTWTTAEVGGTNAVSFSCGATPILVYVYGTGTSATIPSVSGVAIPAGTSCDWTPRWYSYSIDEMVQGPIAVDALPVERHGYGAPRAFTY